MLKRGKNNNYVRRKRSNNWLKLLSQYKENVENSLEDEEEGERKEKEEEEELDTRALSNKREVRKGQEAYGRTYTCLSPTYSMEMVQPVTKSPFYYIGLQQTSFVTPPVLPNPRRGQSAENFVTNNGVLVQRTVNKPTRKAKEAVGENRNADRQSDWKTTKEEDTKEETNKKNYKETEHNNNNVSPSVPLISSSIYKKSGENPLKSQKCDNSRNSLRFNSDSKKHTHIDNSSAIGAKCAMNVETKKSLTGTIVRAKRSKEELIDGRKNITVKYYYEVDGGNGLDRESYTPTDVSEGEKRRIRSGDVDRNILERKTSKTENVINKYNIDSTKFDAFLSGEKIRNCKKYNLDDGQKGIKQIKRNKSCTDIDDLNWDLIGEVKFETVDINKYKRNINKDGGDNRSKSREDCTNESGIEAKSTEKDKQCDINCNNNNNICSSNSLDSPYKECCCTAVENEQRPKNEVSEYCNESGFFEAYSRENDALLNYISNTKVDSFNNASYDMLDQNSFTTFDRSDFTSGTVSVDKDKSIETKGIKTSKPNDVRENFTKLSSMVVNSGYNDITSRSARENGWKKVDRIEDLFKELEKEIRHGSVKQSTSYAQPSTRTKYNCKGSDFLSEEGFEDIKLASYVVEDDGDVDDGRKKGKGKGKEDGKKSKDGGSKSRYKDKFKGKLLIKGMHKDNEGKKGVRRGNDEDYESFGGLDGCGDQASVLESRSDCLFQNKRLQRHTYPSASYSERFVNNLRSSSFSSSREPSVCSTDNDQRTRRVSTLVEDLLCQIYRDPGSETPVLTRRRSCFPFVSSGVYSFPSSPGPAFACQTCYTDSELLMYNGARNRATGGRSCECSANSECYTAEAVIPTNMSEAMKRQTLQKRSVLELRMLVAGLKHQVQVEGNALVRHLKRRDGLKQQMSNSCDLLTAHLQATSPKRSEDTALRFSVTPAAGDSGFNQWLAGMKMVAQLPEGIPQEFRRTLWLTLAERHLVNRGVDWNKAQRACFNEWTNPDDEELGVQIVKDLHRTGCSLFCGVSGQHNQAVLRRVLLAYARWNKAVGYCQGFNMLAALILQVMDRSEADSVKVMIYLIEGVLPESYFANNLRGLSVDMAVFRDLLRLKLPVLSKHLEMLQCDSKDAGSSYEPPLTNVFTMQWFLTLFCNCLPQETVLRVWDLVFLEGNSVLLRTAIAIWSTLSDRILSVNSADEFYSIMGVLTREMLEFGLMDTNNLIKAVVTINLPELNEMRERYMYNITPWTQSVSTVARRGLRLFYTDEDTDTDEDDEKIAIATAYALFRSPKRKPDGSSTATTPSGCGPQQGNTLSPSRQVHTLQSERERVVMDISALKKQYSKLRERQRQAHIILTAACGGQSIVGSPSSTAMNHLLLGKSALVNNKGRRLGAPPGSIPPSSKQQAAVNNTSAATARRKSDIGTTGGSDTLHWKDERKTKAEQKPELPSTPDSTSPPTSTCSSRRGSSSSTSTELCDEPGRTSDSEDQTNSLSECYDPARPISRQSPQHHLLSDFNEEHENEALEEDGPTIGSQNEVDVGGEEVEIRRLSPNKSRSPSVKSPSSPIPIPGNSKDVQEPDLDKVLFPFDRDYLTKYGSEDSAGSDICVSSCPASPCAYANEGIHEKRLSDVTARYYDVASLNPSRKTSSVISAASPSESTVCCTSTELNEEEEDDLLRENRVPSSDSLKSIKQINDQNDRLYVEDEEQLIIVRNEGTANEPRKTSQYDFKFISSSEDEDLELRKIWLERCKVNDLSQPVYQNQVPLDFNDEPCIEIIIDPDPNDIVAPLPDKVDQEAPKIVVEESPKDMEGFSRSVCEESVIEVENDNLNRACLPELAIIIPTNDDDTAVQINVEESIDYQDAEQLNPSDEITSDNLDEEKINRSPPSSTVRPSSETSPPIMRRGSEVALNQILRENLEIIQKIQHTRRNTLTSHREILLYNKEEVGSLEDENRSPQEDNADDSNSINDSKLIDSIVCITKDSEALINRKDEVNVTENLDCYKAVVDCKTEFSIEVSNVVDGEVEEVQEVNGCKTSPPVDEHTKDTLTDKIPDERVYRKKSDESDILSTDQDSSSFKRNSRFHFIEQSSSTLSSTSFDVSSDISSMAKQSSDIDASYDSSFEQKPPSKLFDMKGRDSLDDRTIEELQRLRRSSDMSTNQFSNKESGRTAAERMRKDFLSSPSTSEETEPSTFNRSFISEYENLNRSSRSKDDDDFTIKSRYRPKSGYERKFDRSLSDKSDSSLSSDDKHVTGIKYLKLKHHYSLDYTSHSKVSDPNFYNFRARRTSYSLDSGPILPTSSETKKDGDEEEKKKTKEVDGDDKFKDVSFRKFKSYSVATEDDDDRSSKYKYRRSWSPLSKRNEENSAKGIGASASLDYSSSSTHHLEEVGSSESRFTRQEPITTAEYKYDKKETDVDHYCAKDKESKNKLFEEDDNDFLSKYVLRKGELKSTPRYDSDSVSSLYSSTSPLKQSEHTDHLLTVGDRSASSPYMKTSESLRRSLSPQPDVKSTLDEFPDDYERWRRNRTRSVSPKADTRSDSTTMYSPTRQDRFRSDLLAKYDAKDDNFKTSTFTPSSSIRAKIFDDFSHSPSLFRRSTTIEESSSEDDRLPRTDSISFIKVLTKSQTVDYDFPKSESHSLKESFRTTKRISDEDLTSDFNFNEDKQRSMWKSNEELLEEEFPVRNEKSYTGRDCSTSREQINRLFDDGNDRFESTNTKEYHYSTSKENDSFHPKYSSDKKDSVADVEYGKNDNDDEIIAMRKPQQKSSSYLSDTVKTKTISPTSPVSGSGKTSPSSPTRFNPFPSRISSRQPKELGVKLGLYSPTKPDAKKFTNSTSGRNNF